MKIKNSNYRKFLDEGIINTISEEHIKQAIKNMKWHIKESKALLTVMYYTGGRPNEVLDIKAKNISKEGSYLKIRLKGSKGGYPRTVYLRMKLTLIKDVYDFQKDLFDDMYLFYHFRGRYKHERTKKDGTKYVFYEKTAKLRHHFKKWFKGVIDDTIPPYYLRHNRFSKLAEAGATTEELRQIKGSRSAESITPYLHMSTKAAKSSAKRIT